MYIAQCNLRNKNIYDVNLYIYIYIYIYMCVRARARVCVCNKNKAWNRKELTGRWNISFGTISYAKDIASAIFQKIVPASLLLRWKKLHVTLDGWAIICPELFNFEGGKHGAPLRTTRFYDLHSHERASRVCNIFPALMLKQCCRYHMHISNYTIHHNIVWN